MSKIFFGVYDYNQEKVTNIDANRYNFYRIFIKGLRDRGNDVFCVDSIWGKGKSIPKTLIEKLEEFSPDLCILGNYDYWALDDYYDGPIWYIDIDGIDDISMQTIYYVRNKIERCKFIVSEESDIIKIKEKFGASENNIVLINLFYDNLAKPTEKTYDLLYFGSNKLDKGYGFLSEFNNSKPIESEINAAKLVLSEFESNLAIDSHCLYNNNKSFVNKRIDLVAGERDANEILGVKKLKSLSMLSDLSLTIKGPGWTHESINYYPELLKCSMQALDYDVNNYVAELSYSKIALLFNEGPYTKGSYLRLIEALSSDACVVAQYSEKYVNIFRDAGVYFFKTNEEAMEICMELLADEKKRKEAIEKAHIFLEDHYTLHQALSKIENKIHFNLTGDIPNSNIAIVNEKDLEKICINEKFRDFKNSNDKLDFITNESSAKKENVLPKIDKISLTEQKTQISEIKKVKRRKRLEKLSKIAIQFGYDFLNRYEKTVFSICGFNIYANLKINNNTNHIFFLSFPLLSLNKKNGKTTIGILFVEKMLKAHKKIFRKLKDLKKKIKQKKNEILLRKNQEKKYVELQTKLKNGEKIKVCLFVSRISCWTFASLYKLLQRSKCFEPIVVVKPFMFQGHEAMMDYMNVTYNKLKTEGYNVIKTYDEETGMFLDLKKTINPDILFYTKYWIKQFHPNYYISNFLDKITFYTSYCFDITHHPEVMNFELNNKVDRYFMASNIHKAMAVQAMDNKAKNVYVVGSPKLDVFFDKTYKAMDVWKPQKKKKKRIIWAPHHSDQFPQHLYQFNAFYELTEFMLDLARKHENEIQIAFKPHPMLLPYLYKKWGKESADAYYEKWANLSNGQLETGEFIDLFLTSDAMILDSISFIAEYTAVNKPAFFTVSSASRVNLNEFGTINFEVLYNTQTNLKEDIEKFIVDVVINGEDYKKEKRTQFIEKYLLPPNGKSASENIYENMLEEIMKGPKFK